MKKMGLWVGLCAVISTVIGLVIFSGGQDTKWPDQSNFEQHG